ncbi:MAG: HAD-IA family hydrolase [Actinomycetota bacterium]|nr:HAD-IA family hydrolase [Actinomycetota bacterium]
MRDVTDQPRALRAVFFDFGGVVLSSPFEAFNEFEAARGLPKDLIRTVNATNPDTNAWAQLERRQVGFDEFCALFEAECTALGHRVDARELMPALAGAIRPAMVRAIDRCNEAGLITACLTNNFVSWGEPDTERAGEIQDVLRRFAHVVESSKVGVRKPDPHFYELACDLAQVEPSEVVFLDDLGVNLKPAKAIGMTTIKVGDPDVAIAELEQVLGIPLRG